MHRYSVQRACTVRQRSHGVGHNSLRRTGGVQGSRGLSVVTLRKEPDMGSTSLSFSLKKGTLAFIRETLPLLSEVWLTYPLGCVTIVSCYQPDAVCFVSLPVQVMYSLYYRAFATSAQCNCSMYMQSVPRTPRRCMTWCTAPTIAVQICTVIAQGQSAHDHQVEVAYREPSTLSAGLTEGTCRACFAAEAVRRLVIKRWLCALAFSTSICQVGVCSCRASMA